MEPQSYGYTAQIRRGNIDFVHRPLIDVEVGSETKSRTFKALVDSGSDVTVMDQSIALLLGISSTGRETGKISGIEEWRAGFIAPVSLKIEKFREETFNFNVLFIEDLSRNFDIILGQHDFFRNFDVTFKKSQNLMYLQRAR